MEEKSDLAIFGRRSDGLWPREEREKSWKIRRPAASVVRDSIRERRAGGLRKGEKKQ